MQSELRVLDSRREEFEGFIAKVNKKAAKLGLPLVQVEWLSTETEEVADESGRVILRHLVRVTGSEPVLAGWRFMAALDHLVGEDGSPQNIVRARMCEEPPAEYRSAPADCAHCGLARRRNKTYILQHEDGRSIQVGSTCLGDFLGAGLNPELAADYQEQLYRLDDSWSEGGGGGGSRYLDLDQILAVSVAQIRINGWISRSQVRQDVTGRTRATADFVQDWLGFRIQFATREELARHIAESPTAADAELAGAAREWARGLANNPTCNDYEHNLSALASCGYLSYVHLGIAVSMVSSYQRHLEREASKALAAKASRHVGMPKKRETWVLTVTRIRTTESQWGMTWIIGFQTADGAQLVWFASSNPELAVGKQYQVKATVKAHGEYQGIAQTTLSRCVCKKVEG